MKLASYVHFCIYVYYNLSMTKTFKRSFLIGLVLKTVTICAQQKNILPDSILVKKIDSFSTVFGKHLASDLEVAEETAQQMLAFSYRHSFDRGKGIANGCLGGVNSYKGNQGKAIEYFIRSAEIFEKTGNKYNAAVTNLNLGNLLIDQEQYDEAKVYYNKAHTYALKENKQKLETTFAGLALIDLETNKSLDQVLQKLDKAEKAAIHQNDTLALCNILRLKGKAYITHRKKLPLAISTLHKSIKLIKKVEPNSHFSLGNAYLYLGEAHRKAGENNNALRFNDSSLVHYKALEYAKGLRLTYDSRKDILANLGNYKDAFEALEAYVEQNDSIFQQRRTNQLARMKIVYETDQAISEKETAEAKASLALEKSKRDRYFLIGAITIALLIFLISLLYFSKIKANKKAELITLELQETQKRLALEKQYRDSELKALKAQMNPHFIFNALNSIQEYIILNKKNLAGDYLGKFADLMRTYLQHSDAGTLTIQDEIESLEMYLELEALRFEDTLSYTFNISEKINIEQVFIPTMLIQPYVENALKHGLLHRKAERKLAISFTTEIDNEITCIIEDNGVGRKRSAEIKEQRSKTHTSFATKATEDRLTLLNYKKDNKIGVQTEDLFNEDGSPGGTRVLLKIPALKK